MISQPMLEKLYQKQLTYAPEPLPFYTFVDDAWRPRNNAPALPLEKGLGLTSMHLITWNIDFMGSQPRARMEYALRYLESLVANIPDSSAVTILLQEMMESRGSPPFMADSASDLTQLCEAPWVRQRFHITDVNMSSSDAAYKQVTLVDRRLGINAVYRLLFVSEYQRDALFVDIPLASPDHKILRLCNVHLDSSEGSLRPVQWKVLAKFLQADDVAASVLAGDCNANRPRDATEPQNNGFKDAYLELGGTEGDENGATWGYQSAYNRWGKQRLDKVVFWGNVEVKSLERIGVGVKVEDEDVVKQLAATEELPFVTDHYGLMSELVVGDGFGTASVESRD